jgi:hypothetical protein
MMILTNTEEHSMLMMVTLFLVKKVVVTMLFVFQLTKVLVPYTESKNCVEGASQETSTSTAEACSRASASPTR